MAKTHQRNKTVPTRTYPVFISYRKGSDLQKLVRLVVKVRIFTTKCTLLYDIGNVGVEGVKNILVIEVHNLTQDQEHKLGALISSMLAMSRFSTKA
ncbi:unnamed protein product [Prunus armeniaca]|uniref:Uncharacterized protein n=1 Tax=Prunus armeniaca TaxID=36596 RepID=A0A6J5VHV8_PRUAR|nr:unnamed protein product [Prunus armeniaca]